jgi:hypothetical protein
VLNSSASATVDFTAGYCTPEGFNATARMLLSSLERIVKSDTRYFKDEVDIKKQMTYKKEHQVKRLSEKFDRLYDQKRTAVLQERLHMLPTSRASKYTIMGDEFNLRKELLIDHPVDEVDARSGRSLLIEAVAGGHLHIVRMLIIDFNANVNCVTKLGKATPLHIAVEFGMRQIASMLITYGANLSAQDMFGRTPLHMVKHLSLFKLLIKYPVDVCAKTHKGLTPLGYYLSVTPIMERNEEIVHTLSSKEDKKVMEITREQVAVTRQGFEQEIANWGKVADDSTMRHYNEEQSKPW